MFSPAEVEVVGVGVGAWCRASLLLRGRAGATATGITRTAAGRRCGKITRSSSLPYGRATQQAGGRRMARWTFGVMRSPHGSLRRKRPSPPCRAVPVRAPGPVWSKSFVNQNTSGSALILSRCLIGKLLLCYVTIIC